VRCEVDEERSEEWLAGLAGSRSGWFEAIRCSLMWAIARVLAPELTIWLALAPRAGTPAG